jgi:hypothetical protein
MAGVSALHRTAGSPYHTPLSRIAPADRSAPLLAGQENDQRT